MLFIVATPIGNPHDITLRALEILQKADCIIGEERRVASTLLKRLELSHKPLLLLNEHSTAEEVLELSQLCLESSVALISDCGTPSFYDPGYQLVKLCRDKKIEVKAIPGASSLMTLLSLVSQKVTQFYFAGFLPADTQDRTLCLQKLQIHREAIVLMDTPYRLVKLLNELAQYFPHRLLLLGLNLTQENECSWEGTALELIAALNKASLEKAEFILMIYGSKEASGAQITQRASGATGASVKTKLTSSPKSFKRKSQSRRRY